MVTLEGWLLTSFHRVGVAHVSLQVSSEGVVRQDSSTIIVTGEGVVNAISVTGEGVVTAIRVTGEGIVTAVRVTCSMLYGLYTWVTPVMFYGLYKITGDFGP